MANQALLDIQAMLRKELERKSETMPAISGGDRVKLAGKVFSLPDGTSSEGPLGVIILDERYVNTYYAGKYNSNNPVAPECSAQSDNANEMKPSTASSDPQHESCDGCPQNEYPDSGGGKPCKNGIRLAIIPADATADSSILMVDISPTGLKGYVTYMKALKAQGVLPIQVLTDLSFDPQASYPKLVFGNPRPHNLLEIAWPLREKAQKLLK
jgi:hypothetical protein